ncbi:hypothetical protein Tco_0665611 [Tanacetum coccineum]
MKTQYLYFLYLKTQGRKRLRLRLNPNLSPRALRSLEHALRRALIQTTIKGLPSTTDEDIHKSSPLSEAKPTNPQDTNGIIQLAAKGLSATKPDEGFEVSDPNHNKGKTSSEVEPDTEPLILKTFGEIQIVLKDSEEEIEDESDKEMMSTWMAFGGNTRDLGSFGE